jgi:hypothetical protein
MTKTATSASTAPTLTPSPRPSCAPRRPAAPASAAYAADDVAGATPSALAAALSELRRVVRALGARRPAAAWRSSTRCAARC